MDRAVTEKEATASCSNAFESRYLRHAIFWIKGQGCEVLFSLPAVRTWLPEPHPRFIDPAMLEPVCYRVSEQRRALVEVDLVDAHGREHDDGHGGQDQDGGRVVGRLVLRQVVYRVRGRDDGDQDELRGTPDTL